MAALLVGRWLSVRHRETNADAAPVVSTAVEGSPVGFGPKGAWIAARGMSAEKLASALGLTSVTSTSWQLGLERSYSPRGLQALDSMQAVRNSEFQFPETSSVFVAPPIDGWTLAVGQRLAFFRSFAFKRIRRDRDPEKLLPFLEALSKEGGSVQYFFTHRVPETHVWAWAESGRIVRAYGYSGERGEIMFDVGTVTAGERALGLNLPGSDDDLGSGTKTPPDERTVIDVAGKWSVDPTRLAERNDVAPSGLIGILP